MRTLLKVEQSNSPSIIGLIDYKGKLKKELRRVDYLNVVEQIPLKSNETYDINKNKIINLDEVEIKFGKILTFDKIKQIRENDEIYSTNNFFTDERLATLESIEANRYVYTEECSKGFNVYYMSHNVDTKGLKLVNGKFKQV